MERATAASKQAARGSKEGARPGLPAAEAASLCFHRGDSAALGKPLSNTRSSARMFPVIRCLERERRRGGGRDREREKTRPLFPTRGENPCAPSGCWEPPCQAALSSLGEGGTSVATPSGHAVLAEELAGQACGLGAGFWFLCVFPPKESRA